MSKPLHIFVCFLAIVVLNRIECIKLTKENVITLGGVDYNLYNKKISEIDPLALEVSNSTTLNIYQNELTEIPESLFERNAKFEKIYLQKNRITFIHPKSFKNLTNLKYLDVAYNPLTSFDFNSLSSSKELNQLYLNENNLTEIHYQVLKIRFPKLREVSFSYNKFNCSFAKEVKDYLDKEHIEEYFGSISCISDEEYAAIVRDRQIKTPVSCECTKSQSNLEDQCYNITMELKNDNTKVKNDSEKLKILNEDLENIINGLKLQLLEKESVLEKVKYDCENTKIVYDDVKSVIKGLKLQLLEQQEKGKDDSAKVKVNIEDMRKEMKGMKSQLLEQQSVIEKGKDDSARVKTDYEDVQNEIKGLKLQLLGQHAVTNELKSATESCCQMTF